MADFSPRSTRRVTLTWPESGAPLGSTTRPWMLPVSTEEFPFDERPPPACAEAAPQSSNSSRTVSKLFKLFTAVLTQAGQTRGVNRKHRGVSAARLHAAARGGKYFAPARGAI